MSGPTTVTAAILVIGDEILSGRTKDKNIGYITEYLTRVGIDVREARVVPDVEEEIVAALNALRARYDYVLTTGGIGPTHDDITADLVGAAFGLPVGEDPRIIALMLERYAPGDLTSGASRATRRRGTNREPDLSCAGLSHRERLRDGRGPGDHADDARLRRQDDADRGGDAN